VEALHRRPHGPPRHPRRHDRVSAVRRRHHRGRQEGPGDGRPDPFFAKYGNNSWAAVQQYQAAQVSYAAAPVIKKYTGVLAAADVYTASTTFVILESIRLDLGTDSQVHP
jgi:hypothetical protein